LSGASSDLSGFSFWIHVSPRARREGVGGSHVDALRDCVGGSHGDALRVAVRAAPEAGRANAACRAALAEAFGVARSEVLLDPRSSGRRKRVRVAGEPAHLEGRFEVLAKGD